MLHPEALTFEKNMVRVSYGLPKVGLVNRRHALNQYYAKRRSRHRRSLQIKMRVSGTVEEIQFRQEESLKNDNHRF